MVSRTQPIGPIAYHGGWVWIETQREASRGGHFPLFVQAFLAGEKRARYELDTPFLLPLPGYLVHEGIVDAIVQGAGWSAHRRMRFVADSQA